MYEFVIKNGNIIDGTGGAAYKADVAIADGKIARIGHIPESAAHSAIEAEGRAVTPGLIYTAMVTWRPFGITLASWSLARV